MYRFDRRSTRFVFLNLGHLYDHLFMLLYATVVIALEHEPVFEGSYGTLLTLSVWGFVAFAGGSVPAGWLGDRWSRPGMLAVFFFGLGGASILTGFAQGPVSLGLGLLAVGVFASIYHPVGIAMVADNAQRLGWELGVNGVFGNLGVALAALVGGFLVEAVSWRAAFIVPGTVAVMTGFAYLIFLRGESAQPKSARAASGPKAPPARARRALLVVAIATVFASLVFHSTTVALPKLFDERLADLAQSAADVGWWAFVVFSVAAMAQLGVGHLLDRYPLKPIFFCVAALQIPLLLIAASATGSGILVVALGTMLLVFGGVPIYDTIVARYATPEWRSRVYATRFLLGLLVAAAAVPLVAVLHEAQGGFHGLLVLLAGCSAAVALCALAMPGQRAEPRLEIAPSETSHISR